MFIVAAWFTVNFSGDVRIALATGAALCLVLAAALMTRWSTRLFAWGFLLAAVLGIPMTFVAALAALAVVGGD